MATTLRFVILGDDRASHAIQSFERSLNSANKQVVRNNATMKKSQKDADSFGASLNKLGGHLIGYGGATDIASRKTNYFQKGLAAVNLATGLAEPLVSSLVVAVGGLGAAFAAAGAGLGAYSLALKPLMTEVQKYQQLQQQAANGTDAAKKKFQEFAKTLPPALRDFAKQVKATQDSYTTWANSLAAPVLAPLTTGLKIVKPLLHDITPLVKAAAGALGTLAGELAQKIQGGGVERIVSVLLPKVRPVMLDLGHSVANVAAGFWGILQAFLPFSTRITGGIVTLTEKFKEWGTTLSGHSGFHSIVQQWQQDWPLIKPTLENFATVVKNILSSLAGMATPSNSRLLWQIANPLLAVAVSLSSHPAVVQTFFYLYMISKGAGQLRGVFGALKGAWGAVAGAIAKLTGGRITLGGQMVESSSVMMAASNNMMRAAEVMAGASGLGGKAAAGVGAAEAAGAGAAGGALRGAIRGGLVRIGGTVLIASLIEEMVVLPILGKIKQDAARGTTFADRPFGSGPKGTSGFESWTQLGRNIGLVGAKAAPAIKSMNDNLGSTLKVAPRTANELGRVAGNANKVAGGARAATAPLNDLNLKQQAVARSGNPVVQAFNNQGKAAGTAKTALNQYTSEIHTNGLRSAETHASRRVLVNDMISAGVKGQKAREDVAKYTKAIHDNGYGSDQARAARQRLINDITNAFKQSQQGKRDMARYTDAVRINGVKSDVAKQARHTLIQDLKSTGLTGKDARTLINKLTDAILGIPKTSKWLIQMNAAGQWNISQVNRSRINRGLFPVGGLSTGGPVQGPGGPTTDRAGLYALSNREYVVKAASADKYGSKAMDAVNQGTARIAVPGMAAGGLVRSGRQDILSGDFGRSRWTVTFEKERSELVTAMRAEMLRQIKRALAGATWPFPGGKDLSQLRRIDEGQDMQYPGTSKVPVLAILPGRVTQFGGDPGGFGNAYPGLTLDTPYQGFRQIYYGHVFPSGMGGRHVDPGMAIGRTGGPTSQGDAAGLPNWLEIGFWPPSWANGPAMHNLLLHGKAGPGGARGGSWTIGGLARLWDSVGGPPRIAHLMAAIAMAESGGRAWVTNPSGASGLWQILGLPFPGNPLNPRTNALMALAKYNTQGLGAWAAYTNGSYRQFMAEGGRIGEPIAGVGMSGRSYMFGEAGPEYVSSQSDMTDVARLLSLVLRELRQIRGHTASAPERTGAATASALNGGSRRVALGRG